MKDEVEGDGNEHGRRDMHTENWRGILKERTQMEDININKKILKWKIYIYIIFPFVIHSVI